MKTMEFEEMKKIWDTQNNQALFVINERALHNRILTKKHKTAHITNVNELLLILVNAGAAIFILSLALAKPGGNLFLYLMASWMLVTTLYLVISRIRRRRQENRYDRTMLGDLDQAISTANYQVRLSQLMRWNSLPIGIFLLFGIWENGQKVWVLTMVLILFSFAHYVGRWEHSIYKARKRELEVLRKKLSDETVAETE
jgi:hypothetical protein